jgi:molybdopterin/thiamine biosynthesis adenylyltransferase/rhodanese-related sulfurtransferase
MRHSNTLDGRKPTVSRGSANDLSVEEIVRYGRHLSLDEVGPKGQRLLKSARVLIVGAGGLGSPASLYLAAAGVGTLGLVDFDHVDRSNLQRQILYGESDVGRPKLAAAQERLRDINPHVQVATHPTRLSAQNAQAIVADYDLVVDGTDNFATRYLVNDVCVLVGRPNVYGSVLRFDGQVSVFGLDDGPCYRCLFREPPPPGLVPSCGEAGVMGVLPGIVGSLQAMEAIKLITGIGEPLVGRLLLIDALDMTFRTIEVRKDPACPACGTREITLLRDYDEYCGESPARVGATAAEISPAELAARLSHGEPLTLIDVREPHEWEIARLEGAQLVPLGELSEAIDTLPRDREAIVYCHHGMRGGRAAAQLAAAGFRATNLAGGIDRWSLEVDASIPRY